MTYEQSHPGYHEIDVPQFTNGILRLVQPDPRYAQASLKWVSNPNVVRYMGGVGDEISLQGEQKRIETIINDPDAIHWYLEVNGEVVGNMNLNRIKEASERYNKKSAMLTAIIDEDWQHKGIATAAGLAICDWAFTDGGFDIIAARAVTQNEASLNLIRKKLGFSSECTEVYTGPDFGEPTEWHRYKQTKETWLK